MCVDTNEEAQVREKWANFKMVEVLTVRFTEFYRFTGDWVPEGVDFGRLGLIARQFLDKH